MFKIFFNGHTYVCTNLTVLWWTTTYLAQVRGVKDYPTQYYCIRFDTGTYEEVFPDLKENP